MLGSVVQVHLSPPRIHLPTYQEVQEAAVLPLETAVFLRLVVPGRPNLEAPSRVKNGFTNQTSLRKKVSTQPGTFLLGRKLDPLPVVNIAF
jgi:hypothetical protein